MNKKLPNGSTELLATGMAIVSHLLSAITIPIIFFLMMNMLT